MLGLLRVPPGSKQSDWWRELAVSFPSTFKVSVFIAAVIRTQGPSSTDSSIPASRDDCLERNSRLQQTTAERKDIRMLHASQRLTAGVGCAQLHTTHRRHQQAMAVRMVLLQYGTCMLQQTNTMACSTTNSITQNQMHTCDIPQGFCEDRFTLGGSPYAMHLHDCVPSRDGTLRHTRQASAVSAWSYTLPPPRTRVRISLEPPAHLDVSQWYLQLL